MDIQEDRKERGMFNAGKEALGNGDMISGSKGAFIWNNWLEEQ